MSGYNYFDFFGVYLNFFSADDKSEVLYILDVELAFSDVNLQSCLLEALNDFLYIYNIFEFVFRINQNVVKIGCNEIIKKIEEDIINVALKRSWTVGQAKKKDFIFIGPISSPERRQFLRVRMNSHFIKHLPNIKLCKDLSLSKLSKSLVNQRQRISILSS